MHSPKGSGWVSRLSEGLCRPTHGWSGGRSVGGCHARAPSYGEYRACTEGLAGYGTRSDLVDLLLQGREAVG